MSNILQFPDQMKKTRLIKEVREKLFREFCQIENASFDSNIFAQCLNRKSAIEQLVEYSKEFEKECSSWSVEKLESEINELDNSFSAAELKLQQEKLSFK